MPEVYREILLKWSQFLSFYPSVPSSTLSQYLWFNKHIKIGNNGVYFSHFSDHVISFIGNLVDINGKYKSWDTIKYEYNLTNKVLNKDLGLSVNLTIFDHNLIKNYQLYTLDKLISKELYNISLCSLYEKPTSQSYYEKLHETTNLNWKKIYILSRKVSIDTNLRMFQYKMFNNILFLNKLLFKFVFFVFNSADETPLHIFYTHNITKQLWDELQYFVSQYLYVLEITPQSALLGFFNISSQQQNFLLMNHLLLIFKHYLYMSREHGAVCFTSLKLHLIKIKTIEQNISPCSSQKKEKCLRKWRVIENILK